MPSEIESQNFFFLRPDEQQLDRIGALAERYFPDDPNTCLIKLRQFGEDLARQSAARNGVLTSTDEPQSYSTTGVRRRQRSVQSKLSATVQSFEGAVRGAGCRAWRTQDGRGLTGCRGTQCVRATWMSCHASRVPRHSEICCIRCVSPETAPPPEEKFRGSSMTQSLTEGRKQ